MTNHAEHDAAHLVLVLKVLMKDIVLKSVQIDANVMNLPVMNMLLMIKKRKVIKNQSQ